MEPKQRLLNKIDRQPNGCWNWTEGKGHNGYGQFWMKYTNWRAHRASWMLFKGPIPDGLNVCHQCDNPSCVNLDHLFLGSHTDNAQDRKSKDRNRKSRFTSEQVSQIKSDLRPQRTIAKEYATTQSHIWRIKQT